MANFSTGQMSLQSEFVDREATGHHSADSIFIRMSSMRSISAEHVG